MIKYSKISLGSKVYNTEAREVRDSILKPKLGGMHCRKCNIDTVISFYEWDKFVLPKLESCCPEFESRIKSKVPGHFK